MSKVGRQCLVLGGIAMLLVAGPAAAAGRRVAVLQAQLDKSAEGQVPKLFDEVLLTAVQDATDDDVIGADDIAALIGFEKQKELVGCEDATCLADIGGALGVDRLVSVKVARVDSDWVVTSKLLNIRTAQVESRSSEFVGGDIKALIQAMPAALKRLFAGGGTGAVPSAPASPAVAPTAPAAAPSAQGALSITTRPSGATCVMGGAEVGQSPCRAEALPVGKYDVELRLPYYKLRRVVAYVYSGVDTKVAYDLEPEPVPVNINPQPGEAKVFLDGEPRGEGRQTLVLAPGTYEVSAELDDYANATRSLEIKPGPALNLDLTMAPGYSESQVASRNARIAWGSVFAALAVAGGVVWGWSGTEAQGALGRLQSSSTSTSSDEIARTMSWGRTTATVADGCIIATSISTAIAGALFASLAF